MVEGATDVSKHLYRIHPYSFWIDIGTRHTPLHQSPYISIMCIYMPCPTPALTKTQEKCGVHVNGLAHLKV